MPVVTVTLGPAIPDTTTASFGNVPATVIQVGTRVPSDQYWCTSPSQEYVLIMQDDGNLVHYRVIGNPPDFAPGVTFNGEATWATGTAARNSVLDVQSDGNLVIYDSNGKPIWKTNTSGTPAGLYVQDDGNVVLYKLEPSWWSMS
jgi:hypothetical protein